MDKEEFFKINYISDFINYINKKNYSYNTYTSYLNDLYYFYMYLDKNLCKVSEDDVRGYITYLTEKKEHSSSIRRKISSLKSFYKFLYNNNY